MIFRRIALVILLALGGLALAQGESDAPAPPPATAEAAHNRAQDDLQFGVRFELAGSERSLVGEARYTHPLSLELFDGGVWAVLELETRYRLGEQVEGLETRLRVVLEVDTEFLTPYVAIRADLIGFQHQGLVWEIGVRGGIDLR